MNKLLEKLMLVGLLAGLTVSAGCAYRTLYFVRDDLDQTRIGQYLIRPRVFSYKESYSDPGTLVGRGFWVSVRVEDVTVKPSSEDWRQGTGQVDSLARAFTNKVTETFSVDSLVIHQGSFLNVVDTSTASKATARPGRRDPEPRVYRVYRQGQDEPIRLVHDGQSLSPRRDYFHTLQFGTVSIPKSTSALRLVLHVSRPVEGRQTMADSVQWKMFRVLKEGHGFRGHYESTHGYDTETP